MEQPPTFKQHRIGRDELAILPTRKKEVEEALTQQARLGLPGNIHVFVTVPERGGQDGRGGVIVNVNQDWSETAGPSGARQVIRALIAVEHNLPFIEDLLER